MKLIIMRHGEAESGADDFRRELTAAGREDIRRMAAVLDATGWTIADLRSSPLVRTRQTADALLTELSARRDASGRAPLNLTAEEEPRLAPGFDLEPATDLFYEFDSRSQAAVWVFHAPDVMRMAAHLTGNHLQSFYFTPGSMLALNLPLPNPIGRAMIVWQQQPEYLKSLFPC